MSKAHRESVERGNDDDEPRRGEAEPHTCRKEKCAEQFVQIAWRRDRPFRIQISERAAQMEDNAIGAEPRRTQGEQKILEF